MSGIYRAMLGRRFGFFPCRAAASIHARLAVDFLQERGAAIGNAPAHDAERAVFTNGRAPGPILGGGQCADLPQPRTGGFSHGAGDIAESVRSGAAKAAHPFFIGRFSGIA